MCSSDLVAVNASDMAGKRVQLFKELVPTLKRVAILSHPAHPTSGIQVQGAEDVARNHNPPGTSYKYTTTAAGTFVICGTGDSTGADSNGGAPTACP